ncbi:MAG: acetate kinase [Clostridiales bacterium]|nr:acetate kinase [Clostridiales bacterium]
MKVLVINCGSSSLKYQLIDSDSKEALAVGICERIGLEMGVLKHTPVGQDRVVVEAKMDNHEVAVSMVINALTNKDHGVIKELSEIDAVGHRVVHGGEKFASSVIITDEVVNAIEECNDLAPLHNPANLIGIRACQNLMKDVPMVAVFDTAFHQTIPAKAFLYGLPKEYYEKYKIRKYGFHGTSHSFVSARMAEFCGLDINNSKIIVCHLGNGASITAVENGKSVDTSMGFTPLSGLIMGTRSGDIDPSIIEFIANKENKNLDEIMHLLNKESGIAGMSGVSSDFRDINDAMDAGNEQARIAFEVFVYRVVKYIGGFVASMNGVDAIAFTAGVGENDPLVRSDVCKYLSYLGITIDEEVNDVKSKEIMISTPDSKVKVAIIPTNEELAIARETVKLI